MKVRIATLLLLVMLLTSCQSADLAPNGGRAVLQKAAYPAEQAMQQGDVVNLHGTYANLDRWERFVADIQSKKSAKVRITQYTTEGDPVFYDLSYDGQMIHYQFNNSMDAFAGQDKGKSATTCQRIKKEPVSEGTRYTLQECASEAGNTFEWVVRSKVE